MTTIILAAGNQERFGNFKTPKQLLNVEGEPLLYRTIRQVVKYCDNITIVSHQLKLKVNGCNFLNPAPYERKTTCHSIIKSEPLWTDSNVILLGDVYYTDDAMATIYGTNEPLRFFTDTGDFFAISFTEKEKFAQYVRQALERWRNKNLMTCPILEIYRAMDLPEHLCTLIKDKTQDFDREYEYQNFLKGISKNKFQCKK